MKRKKLEKIMGKHGWWKLREGGNHTHWTNGLSIESVPRHTEIDEHLAKSIIKLVINNPRLDYED